MISEEDLGKILVPKLPVTPPHQPPENEGVYLPSSIDDLINTDLTATLPSQRFENKDFYTSLGNHLKELRKLKELRQEDVADSIGKTRQYVISIEKGKQSMTLHDYIAIMKSLGYKKVVISIDDDQVTISPQHYNDQITLSVSREIK